MLIHLYQCIQMFAKGCSSSIINTFNKHLRFPPKHCWKARETPCSCIASLEIFKGILHFFKFVSLWVFPMQSKEIIRIIAMFFTRLVSSSIPPILVSGNSCYGMSSKATHASTNRSRWKALNSYTNRLM